MLTFDRLSSVFISNTNHERRPAGAPDAEGPVGAGQRQPRALRRARAALLSRPASTSSCATTTDQPAPADQRAELRALQDLRHQGPDAEHRLGARRRRRTELSKYVGRKLSRNFWVAQTAFNLRSTATGLPSPAGNACRRTRGDSDARAPDRGRRADRPHPEQCFRTCLGILAPAVGAMKRD